MAKTVGMAVYECCNYGPSDLYRSPDKNAKCEVTWSYKLGLMV